MGLECLGEANQGHLFGTSTRKDYAVVTALVIFAEEEFRRFGIAKMGPRREVANRQWFRTDASYCKKIV
jgi:hypothetical protein